MHSATLNSERPQCGKEETMKRLLFTALLVLASVCYGQNIQLKTNLNLPSTGRHATSISPKNIVGSSVTGPSVSLSCAAPTSGVVPNSYNFYRSTTSGSGYVILGSSTTCAYTDATVTFNTTYYYVATAVNTSTCPSGSFCESADSNEASATVGQNPVPNPPTGLKVGTIVANNIPLQWNSPIPQSGIVVNAYTVWRGGNPSLPSPSKIATVTATAYTDNGCKLKLCYYEVKATDTMNKKQVITAPSNIVSAK